MRGRDSFQFKQFTVKHDRCQMKVGTDAVLLGAWVETSSAHKVLDIGTGSGVIALMMAQRTPADCCVYGVESSEADAQQATENVLASPWPAKVQVHHQRIQDFHSAGDGSFDLIVSNPPFFSNSLLPPASGRQQARHTETLLHEELLLHALRLLKPTGRLAVVLPVNEGQSFLNTARSLGLFLNRALAFYSRRHKPQERWLFEFGRVHSQVEEEELVLYKGTSEEWTDSYRIIMKDFYLYA